MDFAASFEPPTPQQVAQIALRHGPPSNEVPASLPWSALLGRGADGRAATNLASRLGDA